MLIASRLLALAVGLFMFYFLLGGLLAYPEFMVPDLILATLLTLAALTPARAAPVVLLGANMFALGVYSVAVANQLELGVAINPPLIAVIAAVCASVVLATVSARKKPL